VDGAALAAKPMRARVELEIVESANLRAHFKKSPNAASGIWLGLNHKGGQTRNLQEFFSFSPLPQCQPAL